MRNLPSGARLSVVRSFQPGDSQLLHALWQQPERNAHSQRLIARASLAER
jgi:hypothetical protein